MVFFIVVLAALNCAAPLINISDSPGNLNATVRGTLAFPFLVTADSKDETNKTQTE